MSSNVLLEVLINRITTLPKSKFTFAPFDLYHKTLANNVSPNDQVDHQTPKSKLNCPWVHFPYSRHNTSYDVLVELMLASLAPSALAGEHRTTSHERGNQPGG
jgi:hypothetical protein